MTVPVTIESIDAELSGDLLVPGDARGIVVFAHGTGSSRRTTADSGSCRHLSR